MILYITYIYLLFTFILFWLWWILLLLLYLSLPYGSSCARFCWEFVKREIDDTKNYVLYMHMYIIIYFVCLIVKFKCLSKTATTSEIQRKEKVLWFDNIWHAWPHLDMSMDSFGRIKCPFGGKWMSAKRFQRSIDKHNTINVPYIIYNEKYTNEKGNEKWKMTDECDRHIVIV